MYVSMSLVTPPSVSPSCRLVIEQACSTTSVRVGVWEGWGVGGWVMVRREERKVNSKIDTTCQLLKRQSGSVVGVKDREEGEESGGVRV